MYLASFAMTVVMYIYFAKSGCGMNQAAITVCISPTFSNSKLTSLDQLAAAPDYLRNLDPPRRPEC
jgi:hypothetical protein